MKIDFVSDIVCPWCAIGYAALNEALARVPEVQPVEWHIQPFELNPQMAPEGEDVGEHLRRKYGLAAAQLEQNRERLRERGASVGVHFGERSRIWNTFDAHRLLHWAGLPAQPAGAQRALKQALLSAYHEQGENVSDPEVLARHAAAAGLDEAAAREVLATKDAYAADVRARQALDREHGISGVPAVIIDDQYLISGGQPVEAFEQALRQILQAQAQPGS